MTSNMRLILLVMLLLLVGGLRSVAPAAAACGSATVVTTETQLNNAIADFNGQAGPCAYEIAFGADIVLTADLTGIQNSNAGVTLLIDGAGFTLDGDDQHDLINIQQSDVTIDRLTVTRASSDAVATFSNSSLRVSRSSIVNNGSDGIDTDASSLVVIDTTIAYNGNDGLDVSGTFAPHIIINSTISENTTRGVVAFSGAELQLTQVTIYGNQFGLVNDSGQATVHNSILAQHQGECLPGTGTVVFNHSLIQDTASACGATDGVDGNIVGVDPLLGALSNNGGPTLTQPLLELTGGNPLISPAVNAGDNDLAVDENDVALDFDQRGTGFPRIVSGTVDMGAYEGVVQAVCPASAVTTEMELNDAITNFNGHAGPGDYEIELCGHISLTADLTAINNANAGVTLLIDGAGFTLDGDNQHDLINIQQSNVTIDRLIVTHAGNDAVAAFNNSSLRVSRSSIVNNGSDGIDTDASSLVVIDSTIAFNGNDGLDLTGTVGPHVIINSTISDNTTRGVVAFSTTNVQLTQVTIYGNQTGVVNSDGQITVHNSILAGNQGDCLPGGGTGTIVFDHSLIEDAATTCVVTDGVDGNIVGVDPLLGALGPNGGLTETHLPDDLSDVIDAGDNDLADDEAGNPLAADQRGYVPRIVNSTVDMGAVEVGAEEPTEPGETAIFMSTTVSGVTADELAFGPEDIIRWDGSEWATFFDGSAAGLTPNGAAKHNINAFFVEPPGTDFVLMSFAQNARVVPGVGKVDGMDAVVWNGSGFILVFDGQDVGLTNKTGEKIDGLHLLPGADAPPQLIASAGGSCQVYLLISTTGAGKVPNHSGGTLSFSGEDVLGFCFTSNGDFTAGKWIKVLDGSDQGMLRNSTDSISLSEDGGTLYLTTKGTFNVDDATGGHSMVYAYDMTTQEFSGPLFSAPANGLPGKVDGLQVE